ncbi:MAG TPA: GNAT family N-acetyltransferase [Acidobacteriota bacterium]|nr:GNAT family N-acetyltransferase [Acidobacteriota bacterium]
MAKKPPSPSSTTSGPDGPAPQISFRPIQDRDLDFLRRLYATTRDYEMKMLDWSRKQKQDFLGQQFEAQHRHYMKHFPQAEFSLILLDGQAAGRLYLDRRPDEIRLVDIALLPKFRNQGVGGRLMERVLNEGRKKNLPVRIHVEKFNPAMRLYRRLGFTHIEDQGVYFLMEWKP